jgi:hypothetical protein
VGVVDRGAAMTGVNLEEEEIDDGTREKRRKTSRGAGGDGDEVSFPVMGGVGMVHAKQMVDSSALVGNKLALQERLKRDGYVMLRAFLRPEAVDTARAECLNALTTESPDWFVDKTVGILAPGVSNVGLLTKQHVAARPAVAEVTESADLFDIAETFLFHDEDAVEDAVSNASETVCPYELINEDENVSAPSRKKTAMTTAYKWLRGVAGGEFTGVHSDGVFLGKGTSRLITVWIPLGEIKISHGALLVASGSHRDTVFAGIRASYGITSVGPDGTKSGWLTDDASAVPAIARRMREELNGTRRDGTTGNRTDNFKDDNTDDQPPIDWRTADFNSGDVVVLSLDVTHMSLANTSDFSVDGDGDEIDGKKKDDDTKKKHASEKKNKLARLRVSVDTRWQLEGDRSDPRVKLWRVRGRDGEVRTVVVSDEARRL